MNSLNLISFVLSLLFMTIKSDYNDTYNDTNTSTTKADVAELMDDFAQSLARLLTDDSQDALDETMEYFDDDDQEICLVAHCYRKENGENKARDLLKNLTGEYDEAEIKFDTQISSDYYAESGYVVQVNATFHNTQNTDDASCESLEISQHIFLLNPELYIIKWIYFASDTDSFTVDCQPFFTSTNDDQDDNNDTGCPPQSFCEVTDDETADEIMKQLYDNNVNELDIQNMKIKSIQNQIVSEGSNIRIVLEGDHDNGDNYVIVTCFVRNDGKVDENSIRASFE